MKIKYIYPLVGFVVPTVIIGYGFVIPKNWNNADSRMARQRSPGNDATGCADWVAEQRGLETSVSRETFAKENPREYWKNFASTFLSILQRMSSPSVRYDV